MIKLVGMGIQQKKLLKKLKKNFLMPKVIAMHCTILFVTNISEIKSKEILRETSLPVI